MSFVRIKHLVLIVLALFVSSECVAQSKTKQTKTKKLNFGYSKNPPIREAKVKPTVKNAADIKNKAKASPHSNKLRSKVSKTVATEALNGKVGPAPTKKYDSGSVDLSTTLEKPADIQTALKQESNEDLRTEVIGSRVADNEPEELTLAKKTREIARNATNENLSPMEIYRVGVDDVLFIGLQNAESSASKYYTVLNDGTIDYPLAGEMVSVSGLTTDEIEELLREKIKLFENPEILVRVREHASHKITVLGLVEKPGEKLLQREAMPLYVIKAEAIVKAEADQVTIRRQNNEPQSFELSDTNKHAFLIYPGDIVEFGNTRAAGINGFVYFGGFVIKSGRQEYSSGMTLTQAIVVAGGLRNSKTKKVIIRRKDSKGLLQTTVYNLKNIRNGAVPDPELVTGDIIENNR